MYRLFGVVLTYFYVSVSAKEVNPCEQGLDTRSCGSFLPRYFYDSSSNHCYQFIYGGCTGNRNNFKTKSLCEKKCVKSNLNNKNVAAICELEKEKGSCKAKIPRYYYDYYMQTCSLFFYGGCGGNMNNFETKEICKQMCVMGATDDPCKQPLIRGPCANHTEKYYFDAKSKTCKHFFYGGCGGNKNNFDVKRDCQDKCNAIDGLGDYGEYDGNTHGEYGSNTHGEYGDIMNGEYGSNTHSEYSGNTHSEYGEDKPNNYKHKKTKRG